MLLLQSAESKDRELNLARFPSFATFASEGVRDWRDPPLASKLTVAELSGKTADNT